VPTEECVPRRTKALGDLHEGLGFTSTRGEDVEAIDLESRVGDHRPSQILEDADDCFG
jgi:hypothetical protein